MIPYIFGLAACCMLLERLWNGDALGTEWHVMAGKK
jgi:hypothetical protein